MRVFVFAGIVLISSTLATFGQAPGSPQAYKLRQTYWRKNHEDELMKNEGWLACAGLYWLEPGKSTIGASPSCKIALPTGATAAQLGTVTLEDGKVSLDIADPAIVYVDAKPVKSVEFTPDQTRAVTGDLILMVIQRGSRIGIRMFDLNSRGRREFEGLKWFPVDLSYRIRAKYVAYDTPRTMQITNVLGDTSPVSNPGYVEFTIDGKKCRLEAQAQGSGLFFNFHDETSGHETYPAGRFLDAPAPRDGFVDLDFNQAVNPPCAFTKYATCPLPPKENFLAVAIRAGEKTHHPISD